jgi:hypothetical protein
MTDPRDKRDGDPPGPGRLGVLWGSDLAGGVLTRRAHVFVVFLLSPARQLCPAAGGRGVVGGRRLVAGVGWGAAAGLAGVVGTSLLHQGLAIGRMSVVTEPEGGLEEGEESCNEP